MGVPATLLRKLYVEGSLRNTPDGFEFSLKNRLAPATITQFGVVCAAGNEYKPEEITLHIGRTTRSADEVDLKRSLFFHVNDVMTVHVKGEPLPTGHHLLTCRIFVQEVGWLNIPIEDDIVGEEVPQQLSEVAAPADMVHV